MAEEEQKPKLKSDKDLEVKAEKAGGYKVHPLVTQIAHRLGAFNIVRNAANERTVDLDELSKQ